MKPKVSGYRTKLEFWKENIFLEEFWKFREFLGIWKILGCSFKILEGLRMTWDSKWFLEMTGLHHSCKTFCHVLRYFNLAFFASKPRQLTWIIFQGLENHILWDFLEKILIFEQFVEVWGYRKQIQFTWWQQHSWKTRWRPFCARHT